MRRVVILFHAIVIFVLAAGLRAWSLRSEPPGFAEMVSTLTALRPPAEYLSQPHRDICPPIYYIILHLLAAFSKSIDLLRVPALVAGSAACVAIYFAGRYLYGAVAGLIAGYLLALHPLHIYFSQEAQPPALFSLVVIGAVVYLVKTAENNRWRDWLLYDLLVATLFYLHREALFLVAVFPIVQLVRAAFFPPSDEQRRIRRPILIQAILLNHLLIAALALPWLSVMPSKLPWMLPKPGFYDLGRVFSHYDLRGISGYILPYANILSLVIYLLFLPPAIRVAGTRDYRVVVPIITLVLALLVPFTYSLFKTSRYSASEQAILTLPFFVLVVSMLISRCNPVVRTVLFTLLVCIFLSGSIRQAITIQKTSWTAMRNKILDAKPKDKDFAVFWPDYTTAIGKYWDTMYGRELETASATEILEQYANLPQDSRMFFVVSQFPSRQPHLYTFRGALAQYANSELLYRERLNMLIEASDLDQRNLNLWYKDPDSLRVLDQPSSNTQFLFTAADPVFRTKDFEWEHADLTYDAKGRRCVWTKTRHVDLNLTVTLSPGSYVIRMHCASGFEQPEYDRDYQRVVNVELLSGADRRKVSVQQETTVNLSTSTDTELKHLHLSIDTEPMLKLPAPAPGTYGLRIYSIAIDQAEAAEPGKT